MPNASRSPRTRWTCLSGPTRPSAVPRSESRTRPWWHGNSRADSRSRCPSSYSSSRSAAVDLQLGHAGVAGVGVVDRLAAVLLGVEADGRRLDPQREVLADQRDVAALVGEVLRDGQDPGVVVAEPEAGRQGRGVRVVELDPDGAAVLADRDRLVEAAVDQPQLVEHPQRGAGEVAQLGVVPLALELGDDDDREHDLVLVEAPQGARVGEQHAGVEDVGADGGLLRHVFHLATGAHCGRPRLARDPSPGARTPRPVLAHCVGPGRSPGAGVPAPSYARQESAVRTAVVTSHVRASRVRQASPLADAAKVRRDRGRSTGATRPTSG